ncbi:proton-conducting transporter transmembrane domain-containing protein [Spongiactinospora gelatinilytica]|uniref:proton-conducting transporter transmembrane domain-containing protein n=1 Tax=Spongiactinospora gelatinilytica TaxID=2666298 RepID=UPI0018F75C9C|nr:proton-conducting transporter membrane subunit [Spongiactinospora gelatinilytica]
MNDLLWLLPGLPAAAGAALLPMRGRAVPALAVSVAAVTLLIAVYAAVARPATRPIPSVGGLRAGLAVDGLAAVMAVTTAAVALAVLVYAAGRIRASRGRFFGLMLVFTAAMLATVTAADLLVLLMAWEVMGACSYALIAFDWRDGGRVRAGGVAFLTTRAADLGLYVAAGCALAGTGSLAVAGLASAPRPWPDLVAGGIVLAALGKSAQLPFAFWLSRAMAGPTPVSALLHSATMVAAGAYLLLRVQPLLAATGWAALLVAWAGALTALLLGAVALAQTDLKQLLAASTSAQIGFAVLAAGLPALAGGAAHLVAHAAVKSLLFLCAGVWLAALGTQDLRELRGAGRLHRPVGVAFALGGAALGGLPPLSLWVTKDAVLAATGSPALFAVCLGAVLVAAGYAARVVLAVWLPPGHGGTVRAGALELLPLPPLTVVAVAFGLVGLWYGEWARFVGAGPGEPRPALPGLALTGVLAVAALARVLRHGPDAALALPGFAGWLGLERAAVAAAWRPMTALARALARFDDRVVGGAVRAVPRLGTALARWTRTRAEPALDGVIHALASTARRLGTLARRPQTGQVHTYLAQAAVCLIIIALLALVVWG